MRLDEVSHDELTDAVAWALDDTPDGASTETELCAALEMAGPLMFQLSRVVETKVPFFARFFVAGAFAMLFSLMESWRAEVCAAIADGDGDEELAALAEEAAATQSEEEEEEAD